MDDYVVEEEAELIDYLRIIWRRRKLILGGMLSCVLVSLLLSLLLPKIYRGSVVLEVGKRYNPSKGEVMDKMELIESVEAVANIMTSDSLLVQLKERVQYSGSVKSLRGAVEVEPQSNSLLTIALELENPEDIKKGLHLLADYIIHDHEKKYEMTQTLFDKKLLSTHEKMKKLEDKIKQNGRQKKELLKNIKNIESQILLTKKQIDTDRTYQKTVEELLKVATVAMDQLKSNIAKLEISKTEPLEILFIQNVLQNNEVRAANYLREINSIRLGMSDREKSISMQRAQIVNLNIRIGNIETQNADYETGIENLKGTASTFENLNAISENTKYRINPLVLDKPVSPRILLNTVIGGVVGLMFSFVLAFFLEYLKQVRSSEAVIRDLKVTKQKKSARVLQ